MSPATRARGLRRFLPLAAGGLCLLAAAEAAASVETSTRFLEFDQTQRLLAYEITLRNLSSLPVSFVSLEADPPAIEGAFEVKDLVRDQPVSQRLSFVIPPGEQVFRPSFSLSYTNYEGERIEQEQERPLLIPQSDFLACDLDSGWVEMRFTLTNPQPEPVLFLELRSENPSLDSGPLELGTLKAGSSISRDLRFPILPGQRFFNPTLYLSYHGYHAEGTRLHRSFYTLLLPDLSRLEAALEERKREREGETP